MECTAKPEDMECPECSICTDPITAATGEVKLACFHAFHLGCIIKWTTRGATNCPMCRTELGEKERVEDDTVSTVSFSEAPRRGTVEWVARYLNTSVDRAQNYIDRFNGDMDSVIDYVRYIRMNSNDPFYIPPLERPHHVPVLPNRYVYPHEDFSRKRYWLCYAKHVEYFHNRGYDTE